MARLAAALVAGFRRELHLTPKPGLVDLADAGSHPDLSLPLMERSIALVGEYLVELGASLLRGEPLARQIAIGRGAEGAMLARLGTNTHRGAVFLGGLLLVAVHRADDGSEDAVRAAVSAVAREAGPPAGHASHGAAARERFRVGGVVREARAGLPGVFAVAVPAFRRAVLRREHVEAASFRALAALMRAAEDTTALHRCGRAGLDRLREDGERLDALVASGSHREFLRERNELYRRMNLTMGGVADLLGLSFGWLAYRGELELAE